MSSEGLHARNLAEAFFYLLVTPCRICGQGPIRAEVARGAEKTGDRWKTIIPSLCKECGEQRDFTFLLDERPTSFSPADLPEINNSREPSHLIDVGQWIVLFRMITEAAAGERDKQQARQLGIEAAMCLDEALKFYRDEESDFPVAEAFFVESSRDRFRKYPEQFSRRRLLELRAKLPSIARLRSRESQDD